MALAHSALIRLAIVGALQAFALPAMASDHADPIDLLGRKPLEGGITDLFVFPRYEGAAAQQRENKLVVILCVRRALTDTQLELEPYTYTIHMDLRSSVSFDDEEMLERYGGRVANPEGIESSVKIAIQLDDDASIRSIELAGLRDEKAFRIVTDENEDVEAETKTVIWSGIRDDPFIFPPFFGTNVVAMVLEIPFAQFPDGQETWLVWATSQRDGEQVDHVGRSLRTQNPRFELLNTLPPGEHVAAIKEADDNPSLMRDLFVRAGFQSLFAYRNWDNAPDVMIYTRARKTGFPNGRLLGDDVAQLLGEDGDTLLKELSYLPGQWPRQEVNDKQFSPRFPYLAKPWQEGEPGARKPTPPMLAASSKLKLAGIALVLLAALALWSWIVIRWHERKQRRREYL